MQNLEALAVIVSAVWVIIWVIGLVVEKIKKKKYYSIIGGKKTFFRFIGANICAYWIVSGLPTEITILLAGSIFTVVNIICMGCIIAHNQSLSITMQEYNKDVDSEEG